MEHGGVSQGYQNYYGYKVKIIRIFWTTDTDAEIYWNVDGKVLLLDSSSTTYRLDLWCKNTYWGTGGSQPMTTGAMTSAGYTVISDNLSSSDVDVIGENTGVASFKNLFTYGATPRYPEDYEGDNISDAIIDEDGDGLVQAKEAAQGTSDDKVDTDGDGLNDYIESHWYLYHDDTFCDTSTPKHCANPDPLKKDLYIEIDWMDNGTIAFKPTSTQLESIEDMFSAHDINIHFDTGYFGGGNELPVYDSSVYWFSTSSQLDLQDFKNGGNTLETGLLSTVSPQFNSYRENIWRYMAENAIAIDDYQYGKDRAIEGLMAHEIGHLLCLTQTHEWEEQNTDCVVEDIDSWSGSNTYKSVMHNPYTLPTLMDLEDINYSDGTSGSGDHDDWGAITEGMGAFINNGNYTIPAFFSAPGSTNSNIDSVTAPETETSKKRKEEANKRNNPSAEEVESTTTRNGDIKVDEDGTTQTVRPATNSDGQIIIEDNTSLSISERKQKINNEQVRNYLLIFAVALTFIVLGATVCMNRGKLFKHKKHSRKK